MNKNLEKEYLEDLDHYDEGMGIHSTSYEKCKERLIRLARIDNANPSEALEEIKTLRGFNQVELNNDENVNKSLDIIEQALLKAQEPKQYLKWEDLEFEEEGQTMKVSLNESIHLLCYYRNMFGSLCMIDNTGITIWEDNKNFFNDLHLERVEE